VFCNHPGADYNGAKPFANIEMVTWGYNLYYSEPTPNYDASVGVNIDPGLRKGKKLFKYSYDDKRTTVDGRHTLPDGYFSTVDTGCSTVTSSKSARDSYEYSSMSQNEVGLSGRVEANLKFPPMKKKGKAPAPPPPSGLKAKMKPGASAKIFARAGGKVSYKQRSVDAGNELSDQRLLRTTARCSSYVAAIAYGAMPDPDPTFEASVKALSDQKSYFELFDDYGTHFMTTIKMGSRYSVTSYIKNANYQSMEKRLAGLDVSVGVSAGACVKVSVGKVGLKKAVSVGVDIGLVSPKEKEAAAEFTKNVNKQEQSSVGAPLTYAGATAWVQNSGKTPVPIKFEMEGICHPSFEGAGLLDECENNAADYCEKHLKPKFGVDCKPPAERDCFGDLDCGDNQVCRKYQCVDVPVCQITLCRDKYSCDRTSSTRSLTLPKVNAVKRPNGQDFQDEIVNGNWVDNIGSVELSEGCSEVEMVDDDGTCAFGKGDNRKYGYPGSASSHVHSSCKHCTLPYDLVNDVCKIRVKAKPPPPVAPSVIEEISKIETDLETNATQIVPYSVISTKFWERADSMIEEVDDAQTRAGGFVNNIGKGMYGYDVYKGSPFSTENAGTDPGFVHRRLWHVNYSGNNLATWTNFTCIPSGQGGACKKIGSSVSSSAPSSGKGGLKKLPMRQSKCPSGYNPIKDLDECKRH